MNNHENKHISSQDESAADEHAFTLVWASDMSINGDGVCWVAARNIVVTTTSVDGTKTDNKSVLCSLIVPSERRSQCSKKGTGTPSAVGPRL